MKLIKGNLLHQFIFVVMLIFLSLSLARSVFAQSVFTTQEITSWPRSHPAGASEIKQYWPKISSNGVGFLATWYESYVVDSTIYTPVYAARFSESGEVLDSNGILIDDDTISYNTSQEPAIVTVGDDYWVLYGYYGLIENLYASVVNSAGDITDTFMVGSAISMATITGLAAAYNGENVMVIWHKVDPLGVYYSLFTDEGGVLTESENLLLDGGLDDHIAIAASGSNFLVAYFHDSIADDTYSLRAVRVDSNGTLLDAEPIVIASYDIFNQSVFDVIPYDGGWLVVYYEDGSVFDSVDNGLLRGKTVSAEGTVSAELFSFSNPIPLNSSGFLNHHINVQQTDDSFLIAWSAFYESEGEQLAMVYEVSYDGTVISEDFVGEDYQGSPMDISRNNSGTAVALWSRGSEVDGDFTTRRLIGGRYVPSENVGSGDDDDDVTGNDDDDVTGIPAMTMLPVMMMTMLPVMMMTMMLRSLRAIPVPAKEVREGAVV